MQIEKNQYEKMINEIGYLAKKLDAEMTILERMKIKKSTIHRISIAIGIYLSIITIFSFIL